MSGRLGLAAVGAALVLGMGASPAAAQRERNPRPTGLPSQQASAHFVIHYTTAQDKRFRTSDEQAAATLAAAERVYARYIGEFGFPTPKDDGDGKTDMYVTDTTIDGDEKEGAAMPDVVDVGSLTGFLLLRAGGLADYGTVAHEYMHVLQLGAGLDEDFETLAEPMASWASADMFDAQTTDVRFRTSISSPLDCDPRCTGDGSYGHWPFFQYLGERFGQAIVGDLLRRVGPRDDRRSYLARGFGEILAGRRTNLARVWADYAFAHASGAWRLSSLRRRGNVFNIEDRAAEIGFELGRRLGERFEQPDVRVRHLAGRWMAITHRAGGACDRPGRLRIRIRPAVPGLRAALVIPPEDRVTARPFTAGRRGASVSQPWTACGRAYVVIANGSASRDARVTVSGSTS